MAPAPLSPVLRHLRKLAGASALRQTTDGQLLNRFAEDRDEGAFAELMRRHGPLVLSTCRRLLGHAQDAEDAFQAVFLVLARKAGSIRKGESVGSFLYGVAYRIAMKERSRQIHRRDRERRVEPPVPTEPLHDVQSKRTLQSGQNCFLSLTHRETNRAKSAAAPITVMGGASILKIGERRRAAMKTIKGTRRNIKIFDEAVQYLPHRGRLSE